MSSRSRAFGLAREGGNFAKQNVIFAKLTLIDLCPRFFIIIIYRVVTIVLSEYGIHWEIDNDSKACLAHVWLPLPNISWQIRVLSPYKYVLRLSQSCCSRQQSHASARKIQLSNKQLDISRWLRKLTDLKMKFLQIHRTRIQIITWKVMSDLLASDSISALYGHDR